MATKPISRCQTADSEVPVFLKQRDVGTFETAVESLESKYRSTWRCSSVQRIKTKMLPLLITEDGRHRVFGACYPKNLLRHKSQEIRYPLWMLALIGKQLAGTFGTFASIAAHGPQQNYITSLDRRAVEDGELCGECIVLHRTDDCECDNKSKVGRKLKF